MFTSVGQLGGKSNNTINLEIREKGKEKEQNKRKVSFQVSIL